MKTPQQENRWVQVTQETLTAEKTVIQDLIALGIEDFKQHRARLDQINYSLREYERKKITP